ncbi:MAG: hypothetical protein IKZ14_09810 [Muribaculaceae bacterium]|nr:hypothetical protein [Muribaculaceae bacterium]
MKKSSFIIGSLAALSIAATSCSDNSVPADVISQCQEYTVYNNRVVQGEFTATAISPTEIQTNYKSLITSGASSLVNFRFSINSRDNELPQGYSHTALIGDATSDNHVFTFGEITEQIDPNATGTELPKDAQWTIRVDMRPMLDSFKANGHFVTATGDSIYADDFKGVWIAGSVDPLSWDFENLYGKHDRKLQDRGDGIFEVTLTVNPTTDRPADITEWKMDSMLNCFPTYTSDQLLVDAVYNMSLECIKSNVRPDNTYRAGAAWDGVWTRDVSYSIYLALAYLDPQNAINSLRAKVKNGRIIQDTGTGGAWPVSSDRIVWAVAAWEIYKTTGDRQWLAEAYDIIVASLQDDMQVVWDNRYRLMHGEQSYLDWREQTYPRWMQPKDIYESMCLGTNVVFARAFDIVEEMAEELNVEQPAEFDGMDDAIANSINKNLWLEDRGYYSEYLYGGIYPIQSQATDNLGQALSVIFDVATDEMARTLISRTPVVAFGTPSVYPQLVNIKPYHNDAVWPFVQSYWNLAAAQVENIDAFNAGFGAVLRAAALFGTQKELFVASNGDYRGTAVNSDKMLWSSTGYVSTLFRVFAGMEFDTDGIEFIPFVPAAISGDKVISNFRYRDAVLDITVKGTGNQIASFEIDGTVCDEPHFPATMTGNHSIVITMANNTIASQPRNAAVQEWMPATPIIDRQDNSIDVTNHAEGLTYEYFINGVKQENPEGNIITVNQPDVFSTVDIVPVNAKNIAGFTMQPAEYIPEGALTIVQAEKLAQPGTAFIADKKKARRFVEITTKKNTALSFKVNADYEGTYFVDVRYANGSGPINTENKCAIRTLVANGEQAGALIMPQRGIDEWLSTGFSNRVAVHLNEGENTLSIEYITPQNINMNGDVNTALIDYIRIIRK